MGVVYNYGYRGPPTEKIAVENRSHKLFKMSLGAQKVSFSIRLATPRPAAPLDSEP